MTDTYKITINVDGQDNASNKLGRVNNELDDMRQSGNNATDGINNLSNAITAAGLAAAAWQIRDKVNELADLGREVQVAQRVFTELAGGTEAAASALQLMRDNTNGAVDNLTLMSGANQLLLTNLATSTDQAAELTQVAVQLGNAMGQDAAAAIENFNAALLNNSYVRLDTLGISAQAVRERVDELKESGLDMSQAFAQATLEQGQLAIERLGDAANTSESAFNRASTQAQNFSQQLGVMFANAAETAAQLLILGDIWLGGDGFGSIETQETVSSVATGIINRSGGTATGEVSVDDAARFAEENPELFNRINNTGAFRDSGSAFEGSVFVGAPVTDEELDFAANEMGFEDWDSMSEQGQILLGNDIAATFSAVAQAQRELNPVVVETTAAIDDQAEALDEHASVTEKNAEALEASAEAQAQALRESVASQEDFLFELQADYLAFQQTLFDEGASVRGDNLFFNPEGLEEIIANADELQQRADEIADMAEMTDFEIITEDEVANAQAMADEARDIADAAIAAADALERASLSEIMGQSDGGRLGELTDIIASNIEDEELRAEFEREANLNSGEETETSVAVNEQLAPTIAAIAEEFGVQAAIAAQERLDAALTEAAEQGMSQDETVDFVTDAVGFQVVEGDPETTYTVQQGDTVSGIAAQTGYSQDEIYEAIGGQGVILQPGQVINLGDGTQLVAISEDALADNTFAMVTDPDLINTEQYEGFDANAYAASFGTDLGQAEEEYIAPYDPYAYLGIPEEESGVEEGGGIGAGGRTDPTERTSTSGMYTEEDAENAERIETSVTNMQDVDLSLVIDPVVEDLNEASIASDTLDSNLTALASANYQATIPLRMVLNDETGLQIARSPAFQQAIEIYFQSNGITFEE